MERENQTIITKDFTQVCSPSQVWSVKKILILFSPVPLIHNLGLWDPVALIYHGIIILQFILNDKLQKRSQDAQTKLK